MQLDIQLACSDNSNLPCFKKLQHYVDATLTYCKQQPTSMTIRIVDTDEIKRLNANYKGKNSIANVLAFSFTAPDVTKLFHLGDLVICKAVVEQEAQAQNKTLQTHWAHMIIHGCLHLLGYDHKTRQETIIMEQLEILLLKQFNFSNPYIN